MSELLLLREYFALCPDGMCSRTRLTEAEKMFVGDGGLILTGVIQRANTKNGNDRIYPKEYLDREMKKYQSLIELDMAYGELDHADKDVVEFERVSHRLVEWWWQGDDLYGKLRVMPTAKGNIIKAVIGDGGQVGTSSRALGSLQESIGGGGSMVGSDLALICFDIVTNPSTMGAIAKPERLSEGQIQNLMTSVDPKRLKIRKSLEGILGLR